MDLAEFKKENEGKPETLEELEKKPVVLEVVPETVNEPWMVSEDDTPVVDDELKPEETEKKDQIPLKKFMAQKNDLRGKITELNEKDKEIERLRLENESFKTQKPVAVKELKRPVAEDFVNDKEYHDALDSYYIDSAEDRFTRKDVQANQVKQQDEFLSSIKTKVDTHYERAAKMIETSAIKPEIYQGADALFRSTIKTVFNDNGEMVSDNLIADMGEGSEKVVYFLGRNESARNKLQSLLIEDPRGIKAAIYLGKQNERLNNPKKSVSNAPEPAAQLKGGAPKATGSEQKQHAKLVASGDLNEAFAIRRAAKINGVDTSAWE